MENLENKYKEKSPFTVPEGYFDQLTDRIMERVEEEKKPQRPRIIQMMKPYLGLAAIFVLALMIVQLVLPRFIDQNKMLMKDGEQAVQTSSSTVKENEVVFDSHFNPTSEEIIEYLATEVDNYELMYAGVY